MFKNFNFLFQYLEKERMTIDKSEFDFQAQSHPDYPSLLAISDTLTFFNIENGALEVTTDEIELLPNRFIALLKEENNNSNLYFIEKKNNSFQFLKEKKLISITHFELQEKWLDVVFLIEKTDNEEIKEKHKINYVYIVIGLLIIVLYVFKSNFYTNLFLMLPALGVLFSIAALKDLFGAKIEIINNFCNLTNSTSCEK
ncbi:hypothetical protein [Flavobacterium sp.]|jgi:hypothetical protein|uniref:hypothetical protein n=1 Tax=Flavobacterium sp. TaxID=239 RepID=UPI0037BF1E99